MESLMLGGLIPELIAVSLFPPNLSFNRSARNFLLSTSEVVLNYLMGLLHPLEEEEGLHLRPPALLPEGN